ncbi:MAG: alpha/beta hydrolase [Micavibrio sp.]|nr:alpha/beta hydrolase [Micavibrio sp.]
MARFFRFLLGFILWSAALLATVLVIATATVTLRENMRPQDAAPKTGHFVTAADAQIFVQEQGPENGPAVILIHGTGAWGALWQETMQPLADAGYRVIAVDLPPFGYSQKFIHAADYTSARQAARLSALVAAMRLDKPTLVCHSVGCRSAVEALLDTPDIFGKAVLVDPALGFADDKAHPHFGQPAPAAALRFAVETPFLREAILGIWGSSPYSIAPIFRGFVYDSAAVTDARVTLLQRPLSVQGLTAAEGAWFENLTAAPETGKVADYKQYAHITMPLQIIWGREDNITPVWQAKALQMLLPQPRLTVLEGAGHIPYIETTATFNAALLGFLKGGE